MAQRIVVIGGGAAGIGAAGAAKGTDPSADVRVYTEFEDVGYSPCGIPYVHGREIPDFARLFLATRATYDNAGIYATEATIAGDPQLDVTSDTSYTADATGATEVQPRTQRNAVPLNWVIGTYRAGATRGTWESLLLASPPINRVFTKPTEQVTVGDFGFRAKTTMAAPLLQLAITGPHRQTLNTQDFGDVPRLGLFEG